jgi:hypothetical protein
MATAAPPVSAKDYNSHQLAQILGRNQGSELFFQQPFVALSSPFINKAMNVTRPWQALHIIFRGRVVIGVANFAVVAAEAPQTILQRVRLTGAHRVFGSVVPIDMTGATMFAWTRLFRLRSPSLYINGVRQPDPNVPFGQVGTTFGNVGTYDLEIHYYLPLVPILNEGSKLASIPYMYMGKDWGDTLQLQLFMGDQTSFGTPGAGTTVTFSAFGSGAGSPTFTVNQVFEILGPLSPNLNPGLVIRSSQNITAGMAAAGNTLQIVNLQKKKTLNIMLKTGLILAGTSAGIQVFSSLLDTMLDFTQPTVDNKPIRNNTNNFAAKEHGGYVFGTILPQGYLNFPFDDSMSPLTAYRGDQVDGASTFQLLTNVLTTNAQQAVEVLQEQVFGDASVT